MKNTLSQNTKRKTSSMSELEKRIKKYDKCFTDVEEDKKFFLEQIKIFCNAERGNAKILTSIIGNDKQYISSLIKGKKSASLEKLLEIGKKIVELGKKDKKDLTK